MDPNLTTIETDCLDCNGTGMLRVCEGDCTDHVCPTCKGAGYLTREKLWRGPLDEHRGKPSEADADDLPTT